MADPSRFQTLDDVFEKPKGIFEELGLICCNHILAWYSISICREVRHQVINLGSRAGGTISKQ
jgi:hypothetical protein